MKEIDASIDRGEGGEEKEKERKEKESVYTEIFSILNKNGLGKGKTNLKTIEYWCGIPCPRWRIAKARLAPWKAERSIFRIDSGVFLSHHHHHRVRMKVRVRGRDMFIILSL